MYNRFRELIQAQQIVELLYASILEEEEEEGKRRNLYGQHATQLVFVHVGGQGDGGEVDDGGGGDDDGDEVEVVDGNGCAIAGQVFMETCKITILKSFDGKI